MAASLEVQDSLRNLAERGDIVALFEKGLERWRQISPAGNSREIEVQIVRINSAIRQLQGMSEGDSQVC